MCGRFTLRRPGSEVAAHFGLEAAPELQPRYNVAPGQEIAAVRALESGARRLERRRWGLVPRWARDPRIGSRLINARSETVAERRAFAAAFRSRRCIVPADGFFEWERRGRARRPFHIQLRSGALFGIAGLWEEWRGPGDAQIESCTLLTTDANARVRPIHERMPVILDPADYGRWLDPTLADPGVLRALLEPATHVEMELKPVGPRVNRPEFDDPACLEGPSADAQGSLRF